MHVSVIVPCRNEAAYIRPFLASLAAQDTQDLEIEILIADGESTDGTRRILEDCRKTDRRIVIVDNPTRFVSHGLNLAIAAARGDVILRMDVHTTYAPDYIRQCVRALSETGAGNVGGAARTLAEGAVPRAIAAAYRNPFACGGARFHDEGYEGYTDTVPYGCWRKETLEALGLFDESFVRNQDDELNYRLIRSGGRIWQSASIHSWYHPRGSLPALWRQYFQYGFWKVRLISKYHGAPSWRHFAPGTFVLTNLVMLVMAAGAAAGHSRAWLEASLFAWSVGAVSYGCAVLAASVWTARRAGWDLLPYLPLTFAVYQVSYGCGFLFGCAYWLPAAVLSREQPPGICVGLTR